MLNLFYLIIILFIISYQFIEEGTPDKTVSSCSKNETSNLRKKHVNKSIEHTSNTNILSKDIKLNDPKFNNTNNDSKVIDFDKPNPWSKIIIKENEEYPYFFHIKVKIPSLNDFENWKNIVPNIDFIPRSGELIIPSKDEATALALANLIIINLTGQLTIKDIIEKNLIYISIAKARNYDVVQNKLREQIMENLYGTQFNKLETNYTKDLAKQDNNIEKLQNEVNNKDSNEVEAWDGNDFSYI